MLENPHSRCKQSPYHRAIAADCMLRPAQPPPYLRLASVGLLCHSELADEIIERGLSLPDIKTLENLRPTRRIGLHQWTKSTKTSFPITDRHCGITKAKPSRSFDVSCFPKNST